MKNQIGKMLIVAAAISSLLGSAAHACTGIRTAASDLKAKQYYFRTYENSQIRMVDLMKMNLDGKDMVKISMKGPESIKSLNP